MRRAYNGLIVVGLMFALGAIGLAQPPERKDKKGPGDKEKGPKGFQLGKVLPPFALDELELTEEQEAKIAALEKQVKARLEKILTPKQKRLLENLRPPRKGKDEDKKDKDEDKKDEGKKDKKDKKDKDDNVRNGNTAGGIQWFATLESARAEAKRTGRPILLVSAAPHCSGVSGIW